MIQFFLFLPLILAGSDYDLEGTAPLSYTWTSHYDRLEHNGQWVNYVWSVNPDYLIFDSANISFELNRADCSLSLKDPLTGKLSISNYSKSFQIDGIDTVLPQCNLDEVLPLEDGLKITTTQNGGGFDFKTIFEADAAGTIEWTYELINGDLLTSKQFTIIEECPKCNVLETEGDRFIMDTYYLDTKNRVHGALKGEDTRNGLSLIYETDPTDFLEKEIIDPTFGYTSGTFYRVGPSGGLGASCEFVPYTIDNTNGQMIKWDDLQPSICYIQAPRWNITSIPDYAVIDSVNVQIDVGGLTNPIVCDWKEITTDPDTAAASALWIDILSGTFFLNADAGCTTAGTDKVFDMGADGITDVQNNLSVDWWAVGISYDDMVRDTSDHFVTFTDPELEVQYSLYDEPDATLSQTVTAIGDIIQVNGTVTINEVGDDGTPANITAIVQYMNGTAFETNNTINNGTAEPYTITYGSFWQYITDDLIKNITTVAQIQNQNSTLNFTISNFTARQYEANYSLAVVPSQGLVNYTFPDAGTLQVNRFQDNTTWQIECNWLDLSDAFLGVASTEWANETAIGAARLSMPLGTAYTICYNDDELFTTATPTNYTSQLQGGLVIFDELGGFMGAPAALLVVMGIISLASGRNFPVIAVIAISTIGVMGALGLLLLDAEIWGLLVVAAGITIFGIRKFF